MPKTKREIAARADLVRILSRVEVGSAGESRELGDVAADLLADAIEAMIDARLSRGDEPKSGPPVLGF